MQVDDEKAGKEKRSPLTDLYGRNTGRENLEVRDEKQQNCLLKPQEGQRVSYVETTLPLEFSLKAFLSRTQNVGDVSKSRGWRREALKNLGSCPTEVCFFLQFIIRVFFIGIFYGVFSSSFWRRDHLQRNLLSVIPSSVSPSPPTFVMITS
jgi:hypothetical protein